MLDITNVLRLVSLWGLWSLKSDSKGDKDGGRTLWGGWWWWGWGGGGSWRHSFVKLADLPISGVASPRPPPPPAFYNLPRSDRPLDQISHVHLDLISLFLVRGNLFQNFLPFSLTSVKLLRLSPRSVISVLYLFCWSLTSMSCQCCCESQIGSRRTIGIIELFSINNRNYLLCEAHPVVSVGPVFPLSNLLNSITSLISQYVLPLSVDYPSH